MFAVLFPLGGLLLLPTKRARRSLLRILGMVVMLVLVAGVLNGCSNAPRPGNTSTPTGSQVVNVTTSAYGVSVTTPITVTIN